MVEKNKIIKKLDEDNLYDKNKTLEKCNSCEQQTAPDGGWGWVVVFASFMIHVVTDGVVYSFGELFKEILKEYNEGAGKTSLIPSILVGTTLCSGPVSSALVNKFGCRPVTIAGSLISTLCILISIYATSIESLMFTMGLGTGIGFGLIYLPAIVSVTCYFEKYRSIATGIGVCGSGFGTVIFAPLMNISIKKFGLNGTFVFVAFVVLTCVLYGLLLRPLPNQNEDSANTRNVNEYNMENVPLTTITFVEEGSPSQPYNNELNDGRSYSVHDLTTGKGKLKTQTSISQFVSQPTLLIREQPKTNKSILSLTSNHSGIMYKKDVFFTSSIRSIKDGISKSNGYLPTTEKQAFVNASKSKKEKNCCAPCSIECSDIFSEMTHFSLFKDTIFVLFVFSNFLTSIGYNLPYLYIPNQVEEKKYPPDWSSYLLASVGVGNTAGRIILGYASDNPAVNRLLVYNTCLTFCGIACIVNVFCSSLIQYMAYAFVFGFTTGAYVGLTSVITVDLFGLDKLTNAFGMLLLFQGIASFMGPPIAGYLCERFNSYDPAFYLAGCAIGVSGFMLYFVPYIQRCIRRPKLNSVMNDRNY
ncbi:hypothetical protein PGB90_007125 [Kerria lacca]